MIQAQSIPFYPCLLKLFDRNTAHVASLFLYRFFVHNNHEKWFPLPNNHAKAYIGIGGTLFWRARDKLIAAGWIERSHLFRFCMYRLTEKAIREFKALIGEYDDAKRAQNAQHSDRVANALNACDEVKKVVAAFVRITGRLPRFGQAQRWVNWTKAALKMTNNDPDALIALIQRDDKAPLALLVRLREQKKSGQNQKPRSNIVKAVTNKAAQLFNRDAKPKGRKEPTEYRFEQRREGWVAIPVYA